MMIKIKTKTKSIHETNFKIWKLIDYKLNVPGCFADSNYRCSTKFQPFSKKNPTIYVSCKISFSTVYKQRQKRSYFSNKN